MLGTFLPVDKQHNIYMGTMAISDPPPVYGRNTLRPRPSLFSSYMLQQIPRLTPQDRAELVDDYERDIFI